MSRQKKSRKPSPLAPKQKPRLKKSELDSLDKKIKKSKGRKPGSRNNPITKPSSQKPIATNKDPRHGSKKPIELNPTVVEPVETPNFEPQVKLKKVKQPELTPEQELEQIENDERLNKLLDRAEAGETLTGKDAKYFNTKTARHEALMDILGLSYDDDEQQWQDDEDFDDDFDEEQSQSIIEQWEQDDGDDE